MFLQEPQRPTNSSSNSLLASLDRLVQETPAILVWPVYIYFVLNQLLSNALLFAGQCQVKRKVVSRVHLVEFGRQLQTGEAITFGRSNIYLSNILKLSHDNRNRVKLRNWDGYLSWKIQYMALIYWSFFFFFFSVEGLKVGCTFCETNTKGQRKKNCNLSNSGDNEPN